MGHDQLCGFGTVTEHLWLRFQETQLLSASASKSPSQLEPQLTLGAEPLYFQKSPSLWPTQDLQPRGTEAQVRAPEWAQQLPSPIPAGSWARCEGRGWERPAEAPDTHSSYSSATSSVSDMVSALPPEREKCQYGLKGKPVLLSPRLPPQEVLRGGGGGGTVKLARPSSAL